MNLRRRLRLRYHRWRLDHIEAELRNLIRARRQAYLYAAIDGDVMSPYLLTLSIRRLRKSGRQHRTAIRRLLRELGAFDPVSPHHLER